jgi:hypothetical protein
MVTATAQVVASKGTLEMSRTTRWGIGLGTMGFLIAALSETLSFLAGLPDSSPVRLLFDLLSLTGMVLFALGLLGIFIGMKGWKDYLAEIQRDAVLEPGYLKSLSSEGLRAHHIEVLKMICQDMEIDGQGRFLRYCLDHIHKYLAHPYQQDVQVEIKVQPVDPSLLRVVETLKYTSRRGGDRIQDRVVWQANSKEVLSVEGLKVELRWPRDHKEAGRRIVVGLGDLRHEDMPDGSHRYEHRLGRSGMIDGLAVNVQATYLVHPSSFNTWRSSAPSRGVDVWISYPPELELQFLPFVLDNEPGAQQHGRGSLDVRFTSWLMPGSGFAWKLLAADLPEEVQIESNATELEDIIANAAE